MLEHKTSKKLSPGKNSPLGATLNSDGVNFAIYSEYSAQVYLLLFDMPDKEGRGAIMKIHARGKRFGKIGQVGGGFGKLRGSAGSIHERGMKKLKT